MNKEQREGITKALDTLAVIAFTTWVVVTTGHARLDNPLVFWETCLLLVCASGLFVISYLMRE